MSALLVVIYKQPEDDEEEEGDEDLRWEWEEEERNQAVVNSNEHDEKVGERQESRRI